MDRAIAKRPSRSFSRRFTVGKTSRRIAKAAEACALAGSIAEGATVSMDIEQIISEAERLQDAASLHKSPV